MNDCRKQLDCSPRTQAVRLLDVFALGPAMFVLGRRTPGALGAFVSVAGLTTVAFNGARFLRARRRAAEDS